MAESGANIDLWSSRVVGVFIRLLEWRWKKGQMQRNCICRDEPAFFLASVSAGSPLALALLREGLGDEDLVLGGDGAWPER